MHICYLTPIETLFVHNSRSWLDSFLRGCAISGSVPNKSNNHRPQCGSLSDSVYEHQMRIEDSRGTNRISPMCVKDADGGEQQWDRFRNRIQATEGCHNQQCTTWWWQDRHDKELRWLHDQERNELAFQLQEQFDASELIICKTELLKITLLFFKSVWTACNLNLVSLCER